MKRIIYILVVQWGILLNGNAQSITEAKALFEQGDEFYIDAHDLEKANISYQKALFILEKCGATNLLLYYQILFELAEVAAERNDFLSAIRYMEKAIAVENDTVKAFSAKDEGVYTPKRLLSDYYAQAGMWDKALILKKQRIESKLKEYEKTKNGLSDFKFDIIIEDFMNWIKNAIDYKFALRIIKKVQELYSSSTYYDRWLGDCYYNLNDYEKALNSYKKAGYKVGITRVLAAKGNITEALSMQEKIVEEEKEHRKHVIYISGHEPYWDYLSMLASYYIMLGQYDKAINCEKQNQESVYSFLNISKAYAGKQDWEKAKEYAINAYQLHSQERMKTLILAELAKCLFSTNDVHNLQSSIAELIKFSGDELLLSFQDLTYNERSIYIEEYLDIFNQQIPTYAYYTHSDSIIEAAFNASLMMKGALLNSENSVKRVVEESKDDSLIDLWDEMRADRYILSKELEIDSLRRKLDVDSLQKVIYNLEDSLIVKCQKYGDITRSVNLKWIVIQQYLHSDDLAIEFLSFPINNDSVMYVALSLRKDSKCPQIITLFERKQLKQVSDTLYYQSKDMADLVWKPLQSELEGIKNIYFSPSGALYNIGIEYLPGMENYTIYRLSSTRELVTGGKTEAENRAVLYGGLDYYAGFDTITNRKSEIKADFYYCCPIKVPVGSTILRDCR